MAEGNSLERIGLRCADDGAVRLRQVTAQGVEGDLFVVCVGGGRLEGVLMEDAAVVHRHTADPAVQMRHAQIDAGEFVAEETVVALLPVAYQNEIRFVAAAAAAAVSTAASARR